MNNKINNKRLAKNTMFLYIRMFVIMAVGLYTSRVVLQALGASDFGVYNVVGGIVLLLCFLNQSMVASTQRYINIALGKDDEIYTSKIFKASIRIHLLLAIIIAIVAETGGLWFLNSQLNIPDNRMFAANIVYQVSIITVFVSINMAPYSAMIIAMEKMSIYAYVSVIDAVVKLLLVIYLLYSPFDRLIVYSVIMALVGFLDFFISYLYCKQKISCCYAQVVKIESSLYKSMLSFSGWAIIGSLAFSLSNQGINMLLNIFFNPVVNAARGISMNVSNYVNQFVGNFTVAVNPQITKSFAANDYVGMFNLVSNSARYSIYLLSFVALPIIFEANFVLTIWLKDFPKDTVLFCDFILAESFLFCADRPLATTCNAIGCVKQINLSAGVVYIVGFVLSWFMLNIYPFILLPLIIHAITVIVVDLIFIYFIKKYLNVDISILFKSLGRALLVLVIPVSILFIVNVYFAEGWIRLFLTLGMSTITVLSSVYFVGITMNEKKQLKSIILKRLKNNHNYVA